MGISSLSLVYSVTEYCAPSWMYSKHTKLVDVQLNNTMRIISGSLKATQITWLPVLSNIAPPHLRRMKLAVSMYNNCNFFQNSLLFNSTIDNATNRLISRSPFWKRLDELKEFNIENEWRIAWFNDVPLNGDFVADPKKSLLE